MTPAMTPTLDLAACVATAWQPTPDMAFRVVIAAGLASLAGWASARRLFPGRPAFVALCVVMSMWLGVSVVEHAAVDAGCKGTVALLSWPIIMSQPPLWVLFLYQYLHSESHLPTLRARLMLAAPAALMAGLALSNGWHGLWYGAQTALGPPIAGLPRLRYDYGPLFYAAVAMSYAWVALAYVLTLRGRRQSTLDNRSQWNAFLVMMTVPMAANVAYIGFGWRLVGVDPTSLAFSVALVGFAWMIGRNRLFTLVPLARRLLFTELPDPVLILDTEQRVIDANTAAHQLAGQTPPMGTPLSRWPGLGTALPALLVPGPSPALLRLINPERCFEVQQRTLRLGVHSVGMLVQLHDVTERERAHAQVVQRLADRDAEQAVLREQALRDPLTGLWNRRALDQRFARVSESRGPDAQLALVLLDLDHFKRVNDRHGHAVGDAVLHDFGAELRAIVRASDAVFRIGGEEFALLLPGADAAQALRRMQGLHEQVAGCRLGGLTDLTFSAGVAATQTQGWDLGQLLAAADTALYRAKAQGRNRTELAGFRA